MARSKKETKRGYVIEMIYQQDQFPNRNLHPPQTLNYLQIITILETNEEKQVLHL